MSRKRIDGFNDWTDDDEYSLLNSRFRHVIREHGGIYRSRRGHRDADYQEQRRPAGPRPAVYRDRSI